ncbi:jg16829 [Pararge aegeria aegeria]|uniref:Jg16829 protein n=1 Tax=Pararge aegeria aegeria TaxID=348720 RepID=A0A8S4SJD9_9NEOP|nr:jg16829 [Pararge aegeria aegeria]
MRRSVDELELPTRVAKLKLQWAGHLRCWNGDPAPANAALVNFKNVSECTYLLLGFECWTEKGEKFKTLATPSSPNRF